MIDEGARSAGFASDVRRILAARGLRGFGDGLVTVLLAGYLLRLGFTPLEVGAIVTATLAGSALLTIGAGLVAGRVAPRNLLLAASALMLLTGIGFAELTAFWPLLVVAFVGTLNPSGGDVSAFLPIEQALLADRTQVADRTSVFARYNLVGALAAAVGALCGGAPHLLARSGALDLLTGERLAFLSYAALGVATALIYRPLGEYDSRAYPRAAANRPPARPLARSRDVVLRLSALFSLDSFAGGFAVQSLLVLWLDLRFGVSVETMAGVFFVAGLLGAASQLASPLLARRIGLVPTMVYTHLPANVFLLLAGLAPTASLAIGLLLARFLLSNMDVPARQAYVMAVVPPEERAAAASFTNVPRSLAAAAAPFLAGLMLEWSTFGWPLVLAGALKAVYDLLLLAQFRNVAPRHEGARR